jgi:DNA-binding phage protein
MSTGATATALPTVPHQIHELMPLVMADVGAIPKACKNTQQHYSFRSIDQVLNAIHPVLVKHKVSLSIATNDYRTEVVKELKPNNQGDRTIYRTSLRLSVHFWAPDGSRLTSTSAGEGLDYGGDKATNKAMSAAFKYALFFGLAIPLDASQIDDSDRADLPKDVAAGAQQAQQEQGQQQTAAGAAGGGQTSQSMHAKCSVEQAKEIIALAEQAGVSQETLGRKLQAKGLAKLTDLTVKDALDTINALKVMITKKQAGETFS